MLIFFFSNLDNSSRRDWTSNFWLTSCPEGYAPNAATGRWQQLWRVCFEGISCTVINSEKDFHYVIFQFLARFFKFPDEVTREFLKEFLLSHSGIDVLPICYLHMMIIE